MKISKILMSLVLFLLSSSLIAQNANEISSKAMDNINIGNMEIAATIHIRDGKGNDRERKIVIASKKFGDVYKRIIRFTAPADVQGTALLVHDFEDKADNMWIYMPALRNVRRIVSNEKGKNFMGSEFTNADMSKPNDEDFTNKIVGSEKVNGRDCWKVESEGKTNAIKAENGFSRRVAYIDKANYLCYKIEYFDLRGNLHREQTISEYRKQPDGKYFAFKMSMKNVKNGRVSDMHITKYQPSSSLPESAFAPTALGK